MERKAEHQLLQWKDSRNRKPLLIYGARQVGKTWLMKKLGEKVFENTLYVNFEKEILLRGIFEQDYEPKRIIKLLETYFNQSVTPGKTLVILDEIQEAKGGLTSLKYFKEEMQELHLIGAGSLLGIALEKETSFPVGQVSFLNLYPMDFSEFLIALGHKNIVRAIEEQDWLLLKPLRNTLMTLLKQYFFVGGMPEAVLAFSETENYQEVKEIQLAILQAYEQDFSKHAPTEIIPRIRMVWNSVVSQLAKENKKFIYGILKEGGRAKEFEQAIHWLENYGLIYRVYLTKKAHFPLAAYADLQAFKVYTLDVGLLSALGNLSSQTLIENERMFTEFKGALTEQFVLQEFKSMGFRQLFYWANDSGSAEVDFMLEKENKLFPIEVKSGENLQSKSLKTFAQKYPETHCFRTSLSDYRKETWMTNIPIYGVTQILFDANPS
jgi:predicted AAA+ superfamily ATPase